MAASFSNGASFACHIALLGISLTNLLHDLDKYKYACIISSLGTISTVLILLSFRRLTRLSTRQNVLLAFCGHMLGTAALGVPQVYQLPEGLALLAIISAYCVILLSFFVTNLACEVSIKQHGAGERRLNAAADAADADPFAEPFHDGRGSTAKRMGAIKASLSLGKVCGSIVVIFGTRVHLCLPLWVLEAWLGAALAFFGLTAVCLSGPQPRPQVSGPRPVLPDLIDIQMLVVDQPRSPPRIPPPSGSLGSLEEP